MGIKKLTKHPKEKFISPKVSFSVGLDLEYFILAASQLGVKATGQEVESVTYFENEDWS